MPARLDIIEKYIQGKKYQELLKKNLDLKSFEKYQEFLEKSTKKNHEYVHDVFVPNKTFLIFLV